MCIVQVDAAMQQLRDALKEEVRLSQTLMRLSGCLEPILMASLTAGMATVTM